MGRHNTGISKGVDMPLIWLYLLLVSVGLIAIFAATYREGDPIIASFLSFKTDYWRDFFLFMI